MQESYPYYLAGRAESPNRDLVVTDKFTGNPAARVAQADEAALDAAIEAAVNAAEPMRQLAGYERQAALQHCVDRFKQRSDELARALCVEAGKPIRDAKGEVTRLVDTFRIAAEEATRITNAGEILPLDISPRAKGYRGMWKRVPLGPCAFITPFNFPLNLAAHKVAPAIAAGCPFVLKPASLTPIGALIIGETLAETKLPAGAFSILPCPGRVAEKLATDQRIKLLSFTGSPSVGWSLKSKAGKKRVTLELGGNAAVVIDADTTGDAMNDAIERVIFGAFYQSGQSCIGVQRILVHESIYDAFRDKLVAATLALKKGDPKDEETFIGPMITEDEAARLEAWIEAATKAGGKLLCGGKRKGNLLDATLLEEVPADQDLVCKEAFGPVAVLSSFKSFDDALKQVNDSIYGLQAGIFTRDIHKAMKAWDVLDVGGVIIGDVPSYRVDHMPYGGVKESGLGREGVKFAIEEMTEMRLLVIRSR